MDTSFFYMTSLCKAVRLFGHLTLSCALPPPSRPFLYPMVPVLLVWGGGGSAGDIPESGFPFSKTIPTAQRWNLRVLLICISLVGNHAVNIYYFICLLALCTSYSENCLFNSVAYLLTG